MTFYRGTFPLAPHHLSCFVSRAHDLRLHTTMYEGQMQSKSTQTTWFIPLKVEQAVPSDGRL